MALWEWLVGAVAVGMLAVIARALHTRSGIRRMAPAIHEPPGDVPRLRVEPGGAFEWTPRGQPTPCVPGVALPVHRWWDAERGPRFDIALAFEILDETPPELLASVTKRAVRAATRALPGRGKVRARAAQRDDPGPTGTVRVRLMVQGIGADASWVRAAAEEFARAFLDALAREGHGVERRV